MLATTINKVNDSIFVLHKTNAKCVPSAELPPRPPRAHQFLHYISIFTHILIRPQTTTFTSEELAFSSLFEGVVSFV